MSNGLPPLREVISSHGLSARKSLGQNFLLDLNLTRKIARSAGSLEDHDVLEIGPGPGGLTRALLMEGARRVIAVEKDQRCVAALEDIARAYPGRLTILQGDAKDLDVSPHLDGPTRIVANLPYNIATELLIRWLQPNMWPPFWSSMTLMFQREVAERIVATPAQKSYGRLSVAANWRCDTRIALQLPPGAFTPPPKVSSSVVHFQRLQDARFPADPNRLERIVALAFNQRRKMLRSSLKGLGPDIADKLEGLGVDPTRRAETLSLEEFCKISVLA